MESKTKLKKQQLIGIALELGAKNISGWTDAESAIAEEAIPPTAKQLSRVTSLIENGVDVLGEAFSQIFSSEQRRLLGAVYTPERIVNSMLGWARRRATPDRVVDAGTGSGRFLVAAGRAYKDSSLLGIEFDPFAAILARGHIAASGLGSRAKVVCGDYREADLGETDGQTLFIGNPPYVRHHLIEAEWKKWLQEKAGERQLTASGLAGLHAYFFLATAEFAKKGDIGVFITAAEWLDVNYGGIVRELFLHHLGGTSIHVIEPAALPFPGTATTGVITAFTVGSKPQSILLDRVEAVNDLGNLDAGRSVRRERLETANRWTPLTYAQVDVREDFVELGELCRVHRGQVTGANRVWIADNVFSANLPKSVLFPSVTKARELFASDGLLVDDTALRRVIDIPSDLDVLSSDEQNRIEDYLAYAKSQGAHISYVASHRRKWWSVGLRDAAPILATYMARRPPMFVRNIAAARHINIAHGLYPRDVLSETTLKTLADFLSRTVSVTQGRTYAGGLTKFEPKEMERLLVPKPDILAQGLSVEEMLA